MQVEHELKELMITEISLVDKAANNKVFLFKRASFPSTGESQDPQASAAQGSCEHLHALAESLRAIRLLTATLAEQ